MKQVFRDNLLPWKQAEIRQRMTEARVTPTTLVQIALRDYMRRWAVAIFWLGLIPYGWVGLLALVPIRSWITSRAAMPLTLLDVAYSLWAALLIPLQITIGLSIVGKRGVHWDGILKAFRRVPQASAANMLLMVPYFLGVLCGELAERETLKSHSEVVTGLGVVCMLGTVVACFRCVAWVPLVVDKDLPMLAALRVAWRISRGTASWLLRVGAWLSVPVLLAVILTMVVPPFGQLVWPVLAPWLMLVWVNAYNQLANGVPTRVIHEELSHSEMWI